MSWQRRAPSPKPMELKDALNEVDYLTVYPNDAEIEGRKRLCNIAYELGNKRGNAVNFYDVMSCYASDYGCVFSEDFSKRFNCAGKYDLTKAKDLYELLLDKNVFEIGVGKPRENRYDFYGYFTKDSLALIYDKIKNYRDIHRKLKTEVVEPSVIKEEDELEFYVLN